MGAIQAQDYNMAKWAIGVRLTNSTNKLIDEAIDKGEIIRTHLLRPTWHFVPATEIYWMLDLTAPRIKASLKSRYKLLNLSDKIFKKSNISIENALIGGRHLTRKELTGELEKADIAISNSRVYHLLLRAELDGIICSGPTKGTQQTYALLQERVPKTKTSTKDESLAKLAKIYFTSRGPATLQDFVWWSGLTVADAKKGLEMTKSSLNSESIDSQTFWFSDSFPMSDPDDNSFYLLPAYDEFIISYKDRNISLPFEKHKKAVSNNGVFRPIIVINGQILGIWKRTSKKDTIFVETKFFQTSKKISDVLIEKAMIAFGKFFNQKTELV